MIMTETVNGTLTAPTKTPEQKEYTSTATASPTKTTTSSKANGTYAAAPQIRKDSYVSPPLVRQATILSAGFALYLSALVWPPLILLIAYAISLVVPYSFRQNDNATTRRQLIAKFEQEELVANKKRRVPSNVNVEHSYWTNRRGALLHTSIMTPKDKPIKSVVCFCHAYADNPCYTKQKELALLVQNGIAVIMPEYEGCGRSDGDLCLIKDWDALVEDVSTWFQEVCQSRFADKKLFLMGESMGGAVAYCVYEKFPKMFSGVVFVCPMCKIADEMLPSQFVVDACRTIVGPTGTAGLLGYLPIAPASGDMKYLSFKLDDKRQLCTLVPSTFTSYPRLATARELLNVTSRISKSISEFDAPFLVLHGLDDRVTDPNLSRALYNESKSTDKSIRLYEGMWHALISGEPDENVQRVLNDATSWILERTPGANK